MATGPGEMLADDSCIAFMNLNNKPILAYSLTEIERCREIDGVVIVAPRERLEQVVAVVQLFGCHKTRKVVPGVDTALGSLAKGMEYVDADASVIVVQECSRPGICAADVSEVIKGTQREPLAVGGRVVKGVPVLATKNGILEESLPGGRVWEMGGPLALRRDLLEKILEGPAVRRKSAGSLHDTLVGLAPKVRLVEIQQRALKVNSLQDIENLGNP